MIREYIHHRHTGLDKGFRPRGLEVTRLEGFSDAVFAFTLTLLMVSLEVPRTFPELTRTIRGFPGFAVCFFFILQVWFKHCEYFRRYGLQDGPTKWLNSALLFVVLFYAYPLKFIWSNMLSGGGHFELTVPDARALFELYGLGAAAVFVIFVFLYRHAWSERGGLELNEIEIHDTRAEIGQNLAMAAVPLLSVAWAALCPEKLIGFSGWLYFSYGPLLTWQGMRNGGRRKKLEQKLERHPSN